MLTAQAWSRARGGASSDDVCDTVTRLHSPTAWPAASLPASERSSIIVSSALTRREYDAKAARNACTRKERK